MIKCLVVDQIGDRPGGNLKAYINPDLVSAILDHHISGCVILCGGHNIRIALSSKEVIEMIRNAESGRVL